jgi:hypothetical protein
MSSVRVDGNQFYFCSTVTQFTAALSLKIALKVQSKSNMETSSQRLKPDSYQTHQHKTDRLTADSRQTQTPPGPTISDTIASFVFLITTFATVRT